MRKEGNGKGERGKGEMWEEDGGGRGMWKMREGEGEGGEEKREKGIANGE